MNEAIIKMFLPKIIDLAKNTATKNKILEIINNAKQKYQVEEDEELRLVVLSDDVDLFLQIVVFSRSQNQQLGVVETYRYEQLIELITKNFAKK
ncbi:MAG: hypothetical protein U0K90_05890 [Bacteroidales bacterium]|nr:hypothetical protein [Bacteroidales bacterium]MEE1119445.1 hypothetical protein [Bacteroidales bacterium]